MGSELYKMAEYVGAYAKHVDKGLGPQSRLVLQHMAMVSLDPCRMGSIPRFYEKTKDNKAAQVFTESRGDLLYALKLSPRAAERAISALIDFGLVERLARSASGRQAAYRLRVAERYDAMQLAAEHRETGTDMSVQ